MFHSGGSDIFTAKLCSSVQSSLQSKKGEAETERRNSDLFSIQPNPYIGQTQIRYKLDEKTNVRLVVLNMLGEQVSTLTEGEQPSGEYVVTFSAKSLGYPPGIYLLRAFMGNAATVNKLVEIGE